MGFPIPDSATVVSTFTISRMLDEDGELNTTYESDGMSHEEALGCMTLIADRIRDLERDKWAPDPDEEDEDED